MPGTIQDAKVMAENRTGYPLPLRISYALGYILANRIAESIIRCTFTCFDQLVTSLPKEFVAIYKPIRNV